MSPNFGPGTCVPCHSMGPMEQSIETVSQTFVPIIGISECFANFCQSLIIATYAKKLKNNWKNFSRGGVDLSDDDDGDGGGDDDDGEHISITIK